MPHGRFQLTHLLRGATQISRFWMSAILFQLTHLLRGATSTLKPHHYQKLFQLTHLLRDATSACHFANSITSNFNSRTSCEVRPQLAQRPAQVLDFNSRTSCEVRQFATNDAYTAFDFNSRTSCEVRHTRIGRPLYRAVISTHAPLARCDKQYVCTDCVGLLISTHAPLARCDDIT